jgi:hypothetical protein
MLAHSAYATPAVRDNAVSPIRDTDGRPVQPAIPKLHDCPGRIPPPCARCREPIFGVPARAEDNRLYHTDCLLRLNRAAEAERMAAEPRPKLAPNTMLRGRRR